MFAGHRAANRAQGLLVIYDLSTSDLKRRSLWAISTLCGLNFVVFFIVALVIGGDAVNGKVVAGHFYLSDHGKPTEVSEAVYTYSLCA